MPEQRPSDMESFIRALPDPLGARAFLERLKSGRAISPVDSERNPLLVARLLTIAAYSPFLAEEILRHPEHITWIKQETERHFDRVKSTEQLSEDLARFITRMMDVNDQTRLARFKRRELLRIYLRDCLGVATLSEVTEELSNLADVILAHAFTLAHQEMVNHHGAPLVRDERGRIAPAEFAIVALGKLGCRELNYASDIDLLFLYSGEGETAGDGRSPHSVISNKEFFTSVASRIVQLIGSNAGEGAVYRIDLRLRPYGRDGDLVWETSRAVDYYREKAHNWERQALLRARASAGSSVVVARFLDNVRDIVFAPRALPDAIREVERAKAKIDRAMARQTGGFNVKLGRGGIREIEFIVQALQLQHGGREPWLRSAQTLIVLARLAEKDYLTETERARLSAAYTFLRTVEHRLQMEHGAQTHRLPVSRERLALLARRCGYNDADEAAEKFLADLESHTQAVQAIYSRVFARGGAAQTEATAMQSARAQEVESIIDDEITRLVKHAALALAKLNEAQISRATGAAGATTHETSKLEQAIIAALPLAINPSRSLRNLSAWAESLATYMRDQAQPTEWPFSESRWPALIERLIATLSSQYLSHILVSRPVLASVLVESGGQGFEKTHRDTSDFIQLLGKAVAVEKTVAAKADALRRAWHRMVIDIGSRDMAGVLGLGSGVRVGKDLLLPSSDHSAVRSESTVALTLATGPRPLTIDLRANNLEQTALAEAVLRVALGIVLESLGVVAAVEKARQQVPTELPFAILALGRLGHAGMDYGSDLDLLIVFDDSARWPPPLMSDAAKGALAPFSPQEFYAKLTSQLVHTLSSITREGLLYRVDLRLRPDGASGAIANGLAPLLAYINERASAWEHSAYLKAREVAGDFEFGARARELITETVFDAASRNASLREELHAMRMKIEREKGRGARANIKWGRGGMTDVYFITRYLQLRDRVRFPTERGTTELILHLGERGSLDRKSTRALHEGYSFLRRLDHWMRLLLDRPTPALPSSQIALSELARALGHASIEGFERALSHHTSAIREVYGQVFG